MTGEPEPTMPPQPPAEPPPQPPVSRWRQLLFSWKGGVAAIIAAIGTTATLYSNIDKLWPPIRAIFVPAEPHAALLHCRPGKVILELSNRGGRPVTVDEPEFTIESSLGPSGPIPLTMSEFVHDDPFSHYDGIVQPGDRDPLSYSSLDPGSDSITPFFSEEERQRGGCRISVSVPVRGQSTPLTDSCPCGR